MFMTKAMEKAGKRAVNSQSTSFVEVDQSKMEWRPPALFRALLGTEAAHPSDDGAAGFATNREQNSDGRDFQTHPTHE